MSRTKLILLGLIAVLALNGVAASSASASFSWWIETTEKHEEVLKAGVKEEFNKAGTVTENLKFTFDGVTASCSALEFKKGIIEGPLTLSAESLELKNCEASGKGCTLAQKEIKTAALVTEIKLVGTKVQFELKTKEPGPIASIRLEGATCALAGESLPITGILAGEIPEAENLTKIKALKINTSEGALKIGSFSSTLKGDGTYSATKGWSAH